VYRKDHTDEDFAFFPHLIEVTVLFNGKVLDVGLFHIGQGSVYQGRDLIEQLVRQPHIQQR
jgi:hypothetical protein